MLKERLEILMTDFGGTKYKQYNLENMRAHIKKVVDVPTLSGVEKAIGTKFITSIGKKKSIENILMAITEKMFGLDMELAKE